MHRRTILLLTAAALALPASAGGVLSIPWSTIDGGGGSSSASGLVLRGTLGQWDAAVSDSPRYELEGGFWPGGEVDVLFRDGFES